MGTFTPPRHIYSMNTNKQKGNTMNTEKKLKVMIDKLENRFEEFKALVDTSSTNVERFEAIQIIKEIFQYKSIAENNEYDNTLIFEDDYSELEQLWFDNKLDD